MISLTLGEIELDIEPGIGGGISRFDWRGHNVFRSTDNAKGALQLANFPLVPFSGRIAGGSFSYGDKVLKLPPNNTEADTTQPLHGHGWLSQWNVDRQNANAVQLSHNHDGSIWPWAYGAEQTISLRENGYIHSVSLTNLSGKAMPAGLGLHPYFPRENARLHLDTDGMWENDDNMIPSAHVSAQPIPDWGNDRPYDNVFTGRSSDVTIDWPGYRMRMIPDPAFSFTHVFRPAGEGFFCVEPVSHMPDAVNRQAADYETGLRTLQPGETWQTHTRFEVEERN